MMAAGIIEPLEESDWVSPMVVQENKYKGEIRIYIDLRKVNYLLMYVSPISHQCSNMILQIF